MNVRSLRIKYFVSSEQKLFVITWTWKGKTRSCSLVTRRIVTRQEWCHSKGGVRFGEELMQKMQRSCVGFSVKYWLLWSSPLRIQTPLPHAVPFFIVFGSFWFKVPHTAAFFPPRHLRSFRKFISIPNLFLYLLRYQISIQCYCALKQEFQLHLFFFSFLFLFFFVFVFVLFVFFPRKNHKLWIGEGREYWYCQVYTGNQKCAW